MRILLEFGYTAYFDYHNIPYKCLRIDYNL